MGTKTLSRASRAKKQMVIWQKRQDGNLGTAFDSSLSHWFWVTLGLTLRTDVCFIIWNQALHWPNSGPVISPVEGVEAYELSKSYRAQSASSFPSGVTLSFTICKMGMLTLVPTSQGHNS